jgi:hypothetical protein
VRGGARLADVRILVDAGLLRGIEPDPTLDLLAGVALIEPRLESLDLGDPRADPVRTGDRNLAAVPQPLEERSGVAHHVAGARADLDELDPARRAPGPDDLLDVPVGSVPLAGLTVPIVWIAHVDERHDVRQLAAGRGVEQHRPGVEAAAEREDLWSPRHDSNTSSNTSSNDANVVHDAVLTDGRHGYHSPRLISRMKKPRHWPRSTSRQSSSRMFAGRSSSFT